MQDKFNASREDLLDLVKNIENKFAFEFESISDFIFKHPELGKEEFVSSKYLVDYLITKGFSVKFPYGSQKTAFRAEFGNGKTTIAFLAEYDALPGYKAPTEAECNNGSTNEHCNAHACGHNWIAATTIGAAVVLSKMIDKFDGKIVVLGTPAEENFGGKIVMVSENAFSDIDIVLQAHLSNITNVYTKALSMASYHFEFTGKATHAAASPYDGINALDAVNLMFAGVGAMRQQLRPDAKVHGIITSGGDAPNIIPDKTSCLFYTRASSSKYCETVSQKLINCAKGAAIMTGASLNYGLTEQPMDNLLGIPLLQKMALEYLAFFGIDVDPIDENYQGLGSTDLGNVSYVCPTLFMEIALPIDEELHLHTENVLRFANSKYSYERMHQVIMAMSGIALEFYIDPEKVKTAKEELKLQKGKYESL